MINHSKCTHEATKAARAECRRQKNDELADFVASKAVIWVTDARREGYNNKLHTITLDEIAQSLGIHQYDFNLARDRAITKARSLGREEILADDLVAPRTRKHAA